MEKISFSSSKSFRHRAEIIKKVMVDLNIANLELIKGCCQKEIALLEQEHEIILPQSYKIFLKHFGRGLGGKVMNDIEILYEDIFGLTNELKDETLIDEEDPALPEKAFVFASRLGEQYMFFDASDLLEEPPIFYYEEYEQSFKKVGDSIFDIVEVEIQLSYNLKIKSEKLKKEIKAKKRKIIDSKL